MNLIYLIATLLALVVVQIGLVWHLGRSLGLLRRYDERLGHLGDALSLLTETTEAGFVSLGRELERLRDSSRRRADSRSAGRGRGPTQDPADSNVSDLEMRLRMQVADSVSRARGSERPRQERGDGPVRV